MSTVLETPTSLEARSSTKTTRRDQPRGLRAVVARHPVTAFLLMAFAIAYPVMSLPILADHGVIPDGWLPRMPGVDTERIASVLMVFLALVPAALAVTWAADGSAGVRHMVSRMLRWRIGPGWWLLVLVAVPTLTLALAVVFGDTVEPVDIVPFVAAQLLGLGVNLVLVNVWEETAWAGLVQTRLERSHGLVVAALLTAVPFALIHMPLHFIGDFSVGSLTTALVTLLIVCALVRLMLGVTLRGTRDSILAVALLHTVFNRSNNDEGIVAGLAEGDGRKLAGLVAVLTMTAIVAFIARGRLGRSERAALDAIGRADSAPTTAKDPA
jgi:uncharacterized protein